MTGYIPKKLSTTHCSTNGQRLRHELINPFTSKTCRPRTVYFSNIFILIKFYYGQEINLLLAIWWEVGNKKDVDKGKA